MGGNEDVPGSLDEVVPEIATILARGYLRYRNGRRLDRHPRSPEVRVSQLPASEPVAEKPLDPSGHRSPHVPTS
jgi:hypothetical protein